MSMELTGKIQDLQNELNCMNDSRDFQDAESVNSGNSHVTSQPVSFPSHPIPGGMLSRSIGMPSRREGPQSIWDTHGVSGNIGFGIGWAGWKKLLVEQLLLLVVEQLPLLVVEHVPNPILFSIRVSMRSLAEVEVTCILFRIRLLQFSV